MSIVNREELYEYFEEGKFPTEAQFRNLIDTLYADRKLIVLPLGATSWFSPKGTFIDDVVIVLADGENELNVYIGTTEEGGEIVSNQYILKADGDGVLPIKRHCPSDETIYFSGTSEKTKIKIYTK
jgi:hypothetical protein